MSPILLGIMSSRWRQFMKRFHPEGIPWPGSLLYNAVSSTAIFRQHYELVAHDLAHYGTAACILDIGTGPGYLLLAMQKLLPEANLVGVDISSAMVAQARRNLAKCGHDSQTEVRVADAHALPFADETSNRT